MCGESVTKDIESIKAEFAAFQPGKQVEPPFVVAQPPTVLPPLPVRPVPTEIPSRPPAPTTETQEPPVTDQLQIKEEKHVVSPPPKEQKLRVKNVTSPPQEIAVTRRVTDGDFCERKAMEFEEADTPRRFPLMVSQIVGSEGAGCDIFSFPTEEAREAFRVGPTRDMASVVRFIEVKGRRDAAAVIELKGNELSAAEIHGERYYLYRLFYTDHGDFGLTILQDPLKHKEALQPAVHVNLGRAAAAMRFSLAGGIQKTTGSNGLHRLQKAASGIGEGS